MKLSRAILIKFTFFLGVFFFIAMIVVALVLLNSHRRSSGSSAQDLESENLDYLDHQISAVIVPHHDLVQDKRASLFKEIENRANPKTIILVSLNHFNSGTGDIITTEKTWDLSGGQINADKDKISGLDSDIVDNQEAAFTQEHGLTNILGDLYDSFPSTKIIPLIIRQNTSKEKISGLSKNLQNVCGGDCLLVASVDCSHFQPGALSQIHDGLTIQALNNLDEDLIWQAEIDSNQSLALAISWAKSSTASRFHLEENTNSGELASDRDAESTSYILGWFEAGDQNPAINDRVSFIIGGDMMFDRMIDSTFRDNKIFDIFSNLGGRLFWGTDLSIANLEGPVSGEPIPIDTGANNMIFNFPPKTPDVLKFLHLNAVSLANNHTLNNGKSGLANTIKMLNDEMIIPIGAQAKFDDLSVARFGGGNAKISVVAIESLEVDTDLSDTIRQEKANGSKVLVFPHWGTEYETTHNANQSKLAHAWIDAGADIVLGSHPHVIQDAELYDGKPIFYSLGNLLFDQTFSSETQHGLIIAGEFKGESLSLVLLPTVQKKLKPELLRGDEKTAFITKMRNYLKLPIIDTAYGYDMVTISQ